MKHTASILGISIAALSMLCAGAAVSQELADPVRLDDAISSYTDPLGRMTQVETGRFGQIVDNTDPAELKTTIDRDTSGNPLSTTLPSGEVVTQSFDRRGNILSRTSSSFGGTSRFVYDSETDMVTNIIDPLMGETTIVYNDQQRPLLVTSPLGREMSATYHDDGVVSTATDSLGTTATVTYDANRLPISVSAGVGADMRVVSRSYTPEGYVDVATDPAGREVDIDYDSMGRILQAALPGDRTLSFEYDANGNLTSLTPPGRPTYGFTYNNVDLRTADSMPPVTGGGTNSTSYEYNSARQVTKVTSADGVEVDYAYDDAGRKETISLPNGDYTMEYSEATGLLTNTTSPYGAGVGFVYSETLIAQANWSGEVVGSVGFDYDVKARVTTLTIAGQEIAYGYSLDNQVTAAGEQTLAYDATTGLPTTTTVDNVDEAFEFNAFGELVGKTVSVSDVDIYDLQFTRDALGWITRKVETIQGVTTTFDYTYDVAGRLETVTEDDTLVATYTYDANGNRTNDAAVYDDQDRLTGRTGVSYGHNARGERTRQTIGADVTQYEYDARGAMIGATLPDATQIDYLLDGRGRRVAKQVGGITTEAWLYKDAINPIAQLDGANNVTQRYIYSNQTNVPAYIEIGATRYTLVTDHLGSVRLVVDSTTGAVLQRIDYDAWGVITNDTNPGVQPFAYAGGHLDNDTGLTHFGTREYDAASAHWTSRDPIRFIGGSNQYAYVSSNPINGYDPTGLSDASIFRKLLPWLGTAAAVAGPFAGGWGAVVGLLGIGLDTGSFTLGVVEYDGTAYSAASLYSTGVGGALGFAAWALAGTAAASLAPIAGALAAIVAAANSPPATMAADAIGRGGDIGTQYPLAAPKNIFATRAYEALPEPNVYRETKGPVKAFGLRNIGRPFP